MGRIFGRWARLIAGWTVALVLLFPFPGGAQPPLEHPAATLPVGLLSYWPFDFTTSDLVGGRDLSSSGGLGFAAGRSGQALDFHGDNNQSADRIVDDPVFNFGAADFAFQAWVQLNSTATTQILVEKLNGDSGPGWSLAYITGSDSLQLGLIQDNMSYFPLESGPLGIVPGTWYHVVARRIGTRFQLFLNGLTVADVTRGFTVGTTTNPLLVGKRNDASGQVLPLDGRIDELAFWNRGLSDMEVSYLAAGFPLQSTGPVPTLAGIAVTPAAFSGNPGEQALLTASLVFSDGFSSRLDPGAIEFETTPYVTVSAPHGATAADLNGDGIPDLVVSSLTSNSVAIHLGDGHGLPRRRQFFVGEPTHAVTVADFDGDGRADLVLVHTNTNRLRWMKGLGNGNFAPPLLIASIPAPENAVTGDFNGDGKPDLAVTSNVGGYVAILLGNGDGTFTDAAHVTGAAAPWGIVTADFNGDGFLDVAFSDEGTSGIWVALGDGAGAMGAPSHYAIGSGPADLVARDLDGDGRVDLAVALRDLNAVAILPGNGDGSFQSARSFATGLYPLYLKSADIDGDGLPDLITTNLYEGSTSILLGRSDGTFEMKATLPGSANYGLAVADFNRDGRPDIAAVRNGQSLVEVDLNRSRACQVTFSSADVSVATVAETGLMTIQGLGSTVITATSGVLTGTAVVSGVDMIGPVFGPISPIVVNASGPDGASVIVPVPSATDNVSGAVTITSDHPGTSFPIGTTAVTFTATDASGNSTTIIVTVTVIDGQAPSFPEAVVPGYGKLFVVIQSEYAGDGLGHIDRYRIDQGPNVLLETSVADERLNFPFGLAFGPQGRLFVSNRGYGTGPSLAWFTDPVGSFAFEDETRDSHLGAPHGLAVSDSFVYEVDYYAGQILGYDVSGLPGPALLNSITPNPGSSAGRGAIVTPWKELFVTECCGYDYIQKFTINPDGSLTPSGEITGGMSNPHGLALSPWGELFVANPNANNISRYLVDASGTATPNGTIEGDFSGPIGLCFAPWGELFVAGYTALPDGTGVITRVRFDGDGAPVFGTPIHPAHPVFDLTVAVEDTLLPDLFVEQTSAAGAVAPKPVVVDNVDSNPTILQTPDGILPPGETMVTYTAIDGSGNVAVARRKVIVRDTTPPHIVPPAPLVVTAPNSGGAVVTVPAPTVSDTGDPSPFVDPYVGQTPTLFPIGTTTVTFVASDHVHNSATATTSVTVVLPKPVITWNAPTAITYGTALSGTQLKATASVPGTFVYTPPSGTVLPAGSATLKADFTPTDSAHYGPAHAEVSITVNPHLLTVTAANKTKVFGASVPPLTLTYVGLVNGDTGLTAFTVAPLVTIDVVATTPIGSYPISVSGGTAPNYTLTLKNGTLTVKQALTATSMALDATSHIYGQPFTATVTVAPVAPGAGMPTGTVRILNASNTQLAIGTLAGGTVTIPFSPHAGSIAVHATYVENSDLNFMTSSSPDASITVDGASTALTLTSTPNPSAPGQAVKFTAKVDPAIAAGSVDFYDGSTLLATKTLSQGTASWTTPAASPLSTMDHSIKAVYTPSSTDFLSTSSLMTQIVQKVLPTETFTSSVASPVVGQATTLTAKLSGFAATPTGTVTFKEGGTTLGSVSVASGKATLSGMLFTSAGSHVLRAEYSGDGVYLPQNQDLPLDVQKASTTTTITKTKSGNQYTFTAKVKVQSPGAGAPTGTVTFKVDGVSQAPIALTPAVTGSTVTFVVTLTGSHGITADYSADSNFNASSGTVSVP